MWNVLGDLQWTWRQATRRPLAAGGVVVTLAAAVGVVTIAASLATAVLWRPLPLAEPDRVVLVWEESGEGAEREASRVTGSRFADWRDHATAFRSLALFGAAGFSLESAGGVVSVRGVRVSGRYFETLGLAPVLGRGLGPDDEVPGRHRVVVLSHALWRQRFGGQDAAIGQTLTLSGERYTIVGVMPPAVLPAWPVNPATVTLEDESRQLWVPIPRTPELDASARSHVFGVLGRLAPGVEPARAEAELDGLASAAAADPHHARVRLLHDELSQTARQPLLVLLAAAGAVLLVACANLAALQAAAFEDRRSELATRAALGAGLGRLVSQLATEALVFAAAGGILGLGLARFAMTRVATWLPPDLPLLTPAALDVPLVTLGAALTMAAGLALAAWPIGRLLADGPMPRGAAVRPRSRVYRVLVTAQVAMAVAVVASAALLGRSLWSIQTTDPGFVIDGVVTADVALPSARFTTPEAIVALEDRLLAGVEAPAQVARAALAYDHPLEANWIDGYRLVGDAGAPDEPAQAELRIVSPGYFEALGVEVLHGRAFANADGLGAPGAAMVNEAFALRVTGGVVGRRLRSQSARMTWGEAAPVEFTIVGVVEDERFRGLEDLSAPALYLSTRQFPQRDFALLTRTGGDARALATDIAGFVRGVEPSASLGTPTTLSALLTDALATRRATTGAVSVFAAFTLILATVGLYAVLALFVANRTRELGVRIALGAGPGRVASRVVTAGLADVAAGLAIGLVLALAAGRLIEGFLVGVSGHGPLTLMAVATAMVMAAVTATILPVARATRVDPVAALRGE